MRRKKTPFQHLTKLDVDGGGAVTVGESYNVSPPIFAGSDMFRIFVFCRCPFAISKEGSYNIFDFRSAMVVTQILTRKEPLALGGPHDTTYKGGRVMSPFGRPLWCPVYFLFSSCVISRKSSSKKFGSN
jgi:hypothetical protein